MGRALRLAPLVLLAAGAARGEERLAVFELFVRGAGAYCIAAAPSVIALQDEMAGKALLLEYPYDSFLQGRVDRFWAAYSGPSPYLPLVVVGSGNDVCQGPVDYAARYRQMIEAERARPPRASLRAFGRTSGAGLRVWGTLTNTGAAVLLRGTTPTFWAVAWEDGRVGLTKTFVRATASKALAADVPPGGTANVTVDLPSLGGADPGKVRALLLLEDRPAGGRWDALQAAVAQPAALSAAPTELTVGPDAPEAGVALDGPYVLGWTAVADVPWLEVSPASGTSVPARVTLRLSGAAPAGTRGNVLFTASGEGMSFTASVAVTAAGPPLAWRAVVPAVAHAPGAFGSLWRTDLAAVNPGDAEAAVSLRYVPVEGTPVVREATVPAGGTREWPDVLASLFGVDAEASASGVVEVAADRPLRLSSRTFSASEAGAFGGYLPAVAEEEALAFGEIGILPQLTRSALFRTNVGVTNLGAEPATASIALRGADGEPLGTVVSVDVPPGGLVQVVDVFGAAGTGDRDVAFATVAPAAPGARVWAYASVIDNRTGDPTIVPLERVVDGAAASASADGRTVPAAAHAPGDWESLWRTDLAVVNPEEVARELEVELVPVSGGAPATRTVTLPPGTRAFPDVLVSLFGRDPDEAVSGPLHFRPDGPIVVSSRTYNAAPAGTYGAHLAGLPRTAALSASRPGVLPQLKRTAATRTNVGLANPGPAPVIVAIRLRGEDGGALGDEALVTVPPGGLVQLVDVFAACRARDAPVAWARIEVRTEGGEVFAYASVIDNRTGDPTIVPAAGLPE